MQRLFFISLVFVFLNGCSLLTQKAEEVIEGNLDEAMKSIDSAIAVSKVKFNDSYHQATERLTDSSQLQKVNELYASVTTMSRLVDSTRHEIDRVQKEDSTNKKAVKELFLRDG